VPLLLLLLLLLLFFLLGLTCAARLEQLPDKWQL
jgi:hypothetical protein